MGSSESVQGITSRLIFAHRLCQAGACAVLLALAPRAGAQAPTNYAVQVSAAVQLSPAQVTLSWPADSFATSYGVYRKGVTDTSWSYLGYLGGNATSFIDGNVSVNSIYEYGIARSTASGFSGNGYICAALDAPLVESRGRVILMVDNSFSGALSSELARLQQDLVGDGWTVIRHDVSRLDSVPSVKTIIRNDYYADPNNTEAVFLFGHIPVPYSGDIAPDLHANHKGAWPADVYYGDVTGNWTDSTVNDRSAERTANRNIPGDGKFDQSQPPGSVYLQVGRVDFANLTCFSNKSPARSELDLLRQYLNKDHDFRHRNFTVQRRGLICDNFGIDAGVPYSATGWMNFAPFFGANNVSAVGRSQYFPTVGSQDYLWTYACGGGQYTTCDGIGSSDDFALTDARAVFTMFFGSYYGDWDNESNFLRASLGSGYILTASCSGLPYSFYHHMAVGQTVGYSTRLTQNNNGLYSPSVAGLHQVHVSLMGDPTLRMHPVSPISGLSAASVGAQVSLSWQPAWDSDVVGYHVYRASSPSGPFSRLTASPVTATAFTDSPGDGAYTYMVRTIKHEQSASGTYFNASQGIFLPVQLSAITLSPPVFNGGFVQLRLTGLPGQQFVIETSPDLVTWSGVYTNNFSGTSFDWAGPAASGQAFYRARNFP